MYRVIDKRRCISYLALRGFGHRLKVASVCSTVASIEVARLSDVTAIEHSYCYMEEGSHTACLSSDIIPGYHGSIAKFMLYPLKYGA